MRILGIDPGTATTGYGLVESKKRGITLLDFGWIKTSKLDKAEKRLAEIYKQMLFLLKTAHPDILAIERLFFNTNAKTAINVSQAQGVIMLAAARKSIPLVEFTPGEVKREVAGHGDATKEQIERAVRKFLSFHTPKKKKTHFDDVADALAVALCFIKTQNKREEVRRDGRR